MKKFQPSMLIHLVCVLPLAFVILFGFLNKNETESAAAPVIEQPTQAAREIAPSPQTGIETLTDSKDGVEVVVTNVMKDGDGTVMNLTFDNHVYDISAMDIKGLSSLNGTASSSFTVTNVEMGGHHIDAEIRFPTSPKGKLIIGLNNEIVFEFEIK